MSKQPSMYHLTAGYPAACLTGSKPWAHSSYNRITLLPAFPGALIVLFSALLALSFSSGFSPVIENMAIEKKATTAAAVHNSCTPKKFSFEYSGIIHLKIVVEQTPDAGLQLSTDMDFTTTPKS